MKKAGVVIAALICIALVCGGYYIVKARSETAQNPEVELTEVQKLITKDLDQKYPATPREVVKLYNRIITCYYKEEYTEEELSQLADQALRLFDEELLANNPKELYLSSLKDDIADYAQRERYIAQSDVCDSSEVLYKTIDGEDIAYVNASYFVREGTDYCKTYQQYVLRKNEQGEWRILVFYQIEAEPEE